MHKYGTWLLLKRSQTVAAWTRVICTFYIWQGSLSEVNPNVVIGSFLVGVLPNGPFPWMWS